MGGFDDNDDDDDDEIDYVGDIKDDKSGGDDGDDNGGNDDNFAVMVHFQSLSLFIIAESYWSYQLSE